GRTRGRERPGVASYSHALSTVARRREHGRNHQPQETFLQSHLPVWDRQLAARNLPARSIAQLKAFRPELDDRNPGPQSPSASLKYSLAEEIQAVSGAARTLDEQGPLKADRRAQQAR